MEKFKMNIDLNILNHLGLNLYTNTTAVLSEVIANAWDADATSVEIECTQESDTIIIIDNGNGMNLSDINNKYLCVGYQKRERGEAISTKFKRPVMGRKGIGKLSLLSIADTICIYTKKDGENNALCLSRQDIESQMGKSESEYCPTEIEFTDFKHDSGTRIVISDIKKNISRVPGALRKKLARRFSVISSNFSISINGSDVTIEDRDYLKKIQFLWPIGNAKDTMTDYPNNISFKPTLEGNIKGTEYVISGWLGTAEKPSDIEGNNKLSIITRGKLSQEDILKDFNEGGIYASYLIGEIHADFLDVDTDCDISTSNRQQFNEEDERYKTLISHIFILLKKIQKDWGQLRKEDATKKILNENESVKAWYETLKPSVHKYAKKIFATIESVHSDADQDERKELIKYGILAFERLRVSDKLSVLDKIKDEEINISQYGEIFGDLQDIESALYWDIANARVSVIRKLAAICDDNSKEKIIQDHIYDNLWLLNPSWERAAIGTERIEQSANTEFNAIVNSLTPEEKAGRIDIRYKSTAGKHIIIELKRYVTSYKINVYKLMEQTDKYVNALKKCLKAIGRENEPIEAICIIGKNVIPETMSFQDAQDKVKGSCRLIQYDQLINDSLESYSEYLAKEAEIGKLRQIIENL